MPMPTLEAYLLVAAALLALGLFGVLAQNSVVMVMMGLELMLSGALLALVAFWRFGAAAQAQGQVFALVALTLMAVEAAVGFAVVIAVYRRRRVALVDALTELRG